MGIEKRYITKAEFSEDFVKASEDFKYGYDVISKVNVKTGQSILRYAVRLQQKWNDENCILIYDHDDDKLWGRVKASDSKDDAGISWYLGFFHGRVEAWKNDPLIVISFRDEIIPAPQGFDKGFELAVIHAISDHPTLFGENWEKKLPEHMREKRKQNAHTLNYFVDVNSSDSDGSPDESSST
ncbi:Uncharacterised protein [Klebsiella pneumoniae]|nr:Uncharacterised protein [Klebsiella pneumoniae]